jgi:HEAT repeat protein
MKTDELARLSLPELLDAVLGAARRDPTAQSQSRWLYVRELHRRGGESIFRGAVAWCSSQEPLERILGADVLAQLGASEANSPRLFAEQSAPVLINLLQDDDDRVVSSALFALGHLGLGKPEELSTLAANPSAEIRHALAYALGGRDDHLSLRTLGSLSRDEDEDVRNWATFGLGSLCEADTPEIRAALFDRLSEADREIRREAMVGLARRGDKRATGAITEELTGDDPSGLALEAAERLLEVHPDEPALRKALERWRPKD